METTVKVASGAIALLKGHVARAGPLADQYYYRLATAYRESSNYTAAADSFLQISRQFSNSSLLLEASYGEALARFNLRDFSRVTALLQDPNGTFQQASKARHRIVHRGRDSNLIVWCCREYSGRERGNENRQPQPEYDHGR